MANCEMGDMSTISQDSSRTETSITNQVKSISKSDNDFLLTKINAQDDNYSIKSTENIDILKNSNDKCISQDDTKAGTSQNNYEDSRKRRRRTRTDDTSCPVCGITIRDGEMESHLRNELERLTKLPNLRPLSQRSSITLNDNDFPSTSRSPPRNTHLIPNGRAKDPGWDTFQRILLNRRKRMRAQRLRGHNGDDTREDTNPACPVCGETLSEASPDSITYHVEACLRKSEEEENEILDIDVEDCDSGDVEEYEWCGETRIRATSMLRAEGQLHALGTKVEHCAEDADVDIEDDEELPYGVSQYSTEDLPPPPPVSDDEDVIPHSDMEDSKENSDRDAVEISNGLASTGAVIKALRERIRELESENGTDSGRFTCLVCHGPYISPLVSVVCWHVHCEQCWLHSLAAKKLCPQCSVIVTPADLRKIYI